jgi:uncharacterized protein (UPF0332 family)
MAKEHPIVIKFNYNVEDFDYLDKLQDDIDRAVSYRKIGVYDTYELDEQNNRAIFYLSSADPEMLFKTIKPILEESPILKGALVDMEMGKSADGKPIIKEYQL